MGILSKTQAGYQVEVQLGQMARAVRTLLRSLESHVAQKRAAGCYYLDRAAGRARGYGGRDLRCRYYSKRSRDAVKADARRPGKASPKNFDLRSHRACSGHG